MSASSSTLPADAAPPSWLDDPARVAWETTHATAVAHGFWDPKFRSALDVMARAAADHLRNPRDPELRMLVRAEMARWRLLPVERVHLGLLRRDGIDADVARLCGLPAAG